MLLPDSLSTGDDWSTVHIEVSIAQNDSGSDSSQLLVGQNALCSGDLTKVCLVAQSHSDSSTLLDSGQYEVVLYTDLSREFDNESFASNSSLRQRIFVGRAVLHLAAHSPDTVSQTGAERKSSVSVTGLLRGLFESCQQLADLESQFISLRGVKPQLHVSFSEHHRLESLEECSAQRSGLYQRIAQILWSLSQFDAATQEQIVLRSAAEMHSRRNIVKALTAFFENWLTSDLLTHIMGGPVASVSTSKSLSQTDDEFFGSCAAQLTALLTFGGTTSGWESIQAACYHLQLLGAVFRATNKTDALSFRLPVAVDYDQVGALSQDLLLALLGHSRTVLEQTIDAILSICRQYSSADPAFRSVKATGLQSIGSCLDCLSLLLTNAGSSAAVEAELMRYVDTALGFVEDSVSHRDTLATDVLSAVTAVWEKMLRLLSSLVTNAELYLNRPVQNGPQLCDGIHSLCKHISLVSSVRPELKSATNATKLIVTCTELLSVLACAVSQQVERYEPVAESAESAVLSPAELEAEFQFSGIMRPHLLGGSALDRHQFQVPDHARRKNYKPATNVTFAVHSDPQSMSHRSNNEDSLGIASPKVLKKVPSVFVFPKPLALDTDNMSESSAGLGDQFDAFSPRSTTDSSYSVSVFSGAAGAESREPVDGPFGGELLLSFLHEHHAHLSCILSVYELVELFQLSGVNFTVGLGKSLRVMGELVGAVLNGLFKGRHANRNIVQVRCCSISQSVLH